LDKYTVASVQLRMRLPQTVEDFRNDLRRFLRAAEAKRARLIVFPELAGAMLVPALLDDTRTRMLRRAEAGRQRDAGVWRRLTGAASGWLASVLKADLRTAMSGLLDVAPNSLRDAYVDVFGGLAREYGVTIVAPSAYLPDPSDGLIYNLAAVFGPTGDLLGQQSKVMGYPDDQPFARRGRTWEVIASEVGRIGLMLGSDVLYPEVGRLLAYQGAEVLVVQGACPNMALYHKLRTGILARMQDNQLFAVASFMVGKNFLGRPGVEPFTGRSAIFAPQELTPRFNGVLVEMGSNQSEGVLSAEWDFVALKRLWETSDTPVRRELSSTDMGQVVAALYTQLRALPPQSAVQLLAEEGEQRFSDKSAQEASLYDLDDLPVLASITSQWPLPTADQTVDQPADMAQKKLEPWSTGTTLVSVAPPTSVRREDETDEMDVV
jgi:predicted amidohydrolase